MTNRYQRHMQLHEIGPYGQQQLRQAKILCVGAGGLANSALAYLVAAGIGHITLLDDDYVSIDNLARQTLYQEQHCGEAKVNIAMQALNAINPNCSIETHHKRLTEKNIQSIAEHYSLLLDCTDNFTSHYLINDYCVKFNKTHIYASAEGFSGFCSVFPGSQGPCLRCIFPQASESKKTCNNVGVLGTVPAMLGMIQATEVIKYILQQGDNLIGRLLRFNALSMQFSEFTFKKNSDCQHTTSLHITPQWIETIPDNAIVLDVRTFEECALEKNILHIPLKQLPYQLHTLDKNKTIIVQCKTAYRSHIAAKILINHGFHRVYIKRMSKTY